MIITRRCEICDRVISKDIDSDWAIRHNNLHCMEVEDAIFFRDSICHKCSRIVYKSKKELEKADMEANYGE